MLQLSTTTFLSRFKAIGQHCLSSCFVYGWARYYIWTSTQGRQTMCTLLPLPLDILSLNLSNSQPRNASRHI
ncbi:hypothetical protein BDW69DRAFT_154639 [Aspergillus filifer]